MIIGTPVLLVLDAQMRGTDAKAQPTTVEAPSPAPHARASSVRPSASGKVGEARLPKGGPLAMAEAPSVIPPDVASSSVALTPVPASAPSIVSPASLEAPPVAVEAVPTVARSTPYSSPFAYCAALANSDNPEIAQISGGVPGTIKAEAQQAAGISGGDFHWRCMDRAVWVCVTAKGSPGCKALPSAVDRGLFCAAHPDEVAGNWSCDGFTPVMSKEQLAAIDRRGFDKGAWVQVSESGVIPAADAGI